VHGRVTNPAKTPVVTGAALDHPVWLDLEKAATLAVEHAGTSREVYVAGPGRVLPCEHGEERFIVASGHVTSAAGAGARPGSEVLLATPFGVVRYGDAKLDLRVDSKGLTLAVEVGEAWLDSGVPGATAEKVAAGGHLERRGSPPDVKSLVERCQSAADGAEAHAREVLAPRRALVPLGVRASEHVRARQAARMACAVAEAALGTSSGAAAPKAGRTPDGEHDDLVRAVEAADARWRAVPSAVHPLRKVESR
jgi:hypothetical protein